MKPLLRAAMIATAIVGSASAQPLQAAVFPSTGWAQCVGGPIGCEQVDFFFEVTGGPAYIDFFRLSLSSPGWTFVYPLVYTETEDEFGLNFFDVESASATELSGTFIFGASLNPQLRFRTEMATFGSDAADLGFSYEGSTPNGTVFEGRFVPATSTVPEPGTVVLLGTGLIGLGIAARRRRTIRE